MKRKQYQRQNSEVKEIIRKSKRRVGVKSLVGSGAISSKRINYFRRKLKQNTRMKKEHGVLV